MDLAQEIRRIMVMAFPRPTDRTTDIVARDVFVEALEDPELIIQVQAQRPADLASALQVAQHMEAVKRTLTSKTSKLARAVVQGTGDLRLEAELRDLKAGQRHLLDLIQQRGCSEQVPQERRNDNDIQQKRIPTAIVNDRNVPKSGTGIASGWETPRKTACYSCGKEG